MAYIILSGRCFDTTFFNTPTPSQVKRDYSKNVLPGELNGVFGQVLIATRKFCLYRSM